MTRYRRSDHVLSYWTETGGVIHNYGTAIQAPATPLIWQALHLCGSWRSPAEIREGLGLVVSDDLLEKLLASLVTATFLEASDRPADPRVAAMAGWSAWNPAAGFFHSVSRQCLYGEWRIFEDRLKAKASSAPMPASVKPPAAQSFPLSLQTGASALDDVLRDRRTWRRFGRRPVRQADFARILRGTLGITHWLTVPDLGEVPLTTSPSGGSRHPIEGYVAVVRVEGVPPGIYRYAADRHELDLVRRGASAADLEQLIPQQAWFAGAAFAVFFTAVFERTQWRYEFPRAYRAVLLEAGHVCQTFLLLASSLGLAPFCTMAVDDAFVENLIGLDGASEAVLYAAGAGTRPPSRGRADMPGSGPPANVRPHRIRAARAAARKRQP